MGSLINVQSLNRHWSVLLDQIQLQPDREGIKEREDGERGGVCVCVCVWGGGGGGGGCGGGGGGGGGGGRVFEYSR